MDETTGTTTGPVLAASRPVRVIDHRAGVAEVLATMRRAGVRHLPVVHDGRCVGLLVDRDVIAAAVDGLELPAGRLARRPVPTVATGTDVATIARTVLDGGLDAALVVDDGELTGIVTSTDALVALSRTTSGPSTQWSADVSSDRHAVPGTTHDREVG